MNKREFAGLANLAAKVVRENIKNRVKELNKERDRTYSEAIKKLREFTLEELKKNPDMLKLELENVHADIDYWRSSKDNPNFKITFSQDLTENLKDKIPKEILEKLRKYYAIGDEISKLDWLSWQVKNKIKEWKLVAIEKGTLNKEPFPAELWPFLTDKLREVLTPSEEVKK